MQVSQVSNVKIYNLTSGKTLPEWISERKRRALVKGDADLQRRIQLIQDFDMPTASSRIHISPDGQYIMASGVYKPRVRCYDVNQLSMKFERCMDSEVEEFAILSDDYSKMVFLHCDRYVEFHSQHGFYYRTRIPKFGRDLVYHKPSCDLFLAGASSEVYRLNLEQGRFLEPYKISASAVNVCRLNPVHQLLALGTAEGCVECWDPRSRARVGVLDVAAAVCPTHSNEQSAFEVSSLAFRHGLRMAVGTSWGQVCLFDLRSDRPLLIKDHQYEEPIKQIHFHQVHDNNLVVSADRKQVKIWHESDGKIFTSIEPEASINDVCLYRNSGLLMMANETPKMQVFYIPTLGTAPKWCSILDSLTEELEENHEPVVYDDYKFVTKQELESLGLTSLLGTPMLRAYMHGFFMDIRLYHKAKSFSEPFAHEEYRKELVQKKLKEERKSRVALQKLPKVNRSLAQRLIDGTSTKKRTKATGSDLMKDDRFHTLFSNPDFQVDEESEEFKRLHPVLSKHQLKHKAHLAEGSLTDEDEPEGKASEDDSSSESDLEEIRSRSARHSQLQEKLPTGRANTHKKKTARQLVPRQQSRQFDSSRNDSSLRSRLIEDEEASTISAGALGNKESAFVLKTDKQELAHHQMKQHRQERRLLHRSANSLLAKKNPYYRKPRR